MISQDFKATPEIAESIVASLTKEKIISSKRLASGDRNFVFDVLTSDNEFVLRMTSPEQRYKFEAAILTSFASEQELGNRGFKNPIPIMLTFLEIQINILYPSMTHKRSHRILACHNELDTLETLCHLQFQFHLSLLCESL